MNSNLQASLTLRKIDDDILRPLQHGPGAWWWPAFLVSLAMLLLGLLAVIYQLEKGIGVWGQNRTVGWAFDITNFVFWIGIGHAGTFISAVLFLLRQSWRVSINRSAEVATLLAVICAAAFPLIHLGRPWLAYWMFPYPNFRGPLWLNFRSPLVWDFFALGTYFTISLVFFYLGLLPDLASVGSRLRARRGAIFRWLGLGWDFSQRAWQRYQVLYLLLAGLATALVVSVHTIVSWDFAVSIVPGWHSTVFPPYFVVGAVFSGLAVVLMLSLLLRRALKLEAYIRIEHVHKLCGLVLVCSCFILLVYLAEFFHGAYSEDPHEKLMLAGRLWGPMSGPFLVAVIGNCLAPQLLWISRVRNNLVVVFVIALLITVGMWFERFVIVVGSLERDFLPSNWSTYAPTSIELATLAGSFGLFLTGFLLFVRWLPAMPMHELKLETGRPSAAGSTPAALQESIS